MARTGFHWRDDNILQTLMLTFLYNDVDVIFLIISDNFGVFCWFVLVVCFSVVLILDLLIFVRMVVDFALFSNDTFR